MHKIIADTSAVAQALDNLANAIQGDEVYLVGIHRGGARVADAVQQRLEGHHVTVHRGNLDISFYRDDLDTVGPNPEVRPSMLPFDVSGKTVWLVDDVLYTGRTIRAAMGEIFDYGRPAAIKLAVLLDRGGRQLPIAADVTGIVHPAAADCSVKLNCATPDWHIEQRQVGI